MFKKINAIHIFLTIAILTSLGMVTKNGFQTMPRVNFQGTIPAEKKPNIIIILADDMGYSDIGCFGAEIRTPYLDALAKGGTRMTQFYNASRCCPTRASLLTGLYQHQAGVGDMVNARKQPAYQGYLNHNCVTIAEALKGGGYTTLMAGKWHVGTEPDKWPRKRGFDRYFGLIDGASSYFSTKPYRPNQKLTIALDDNEFMPGEGFYATNAYTDYALNFIDENKTTGKPFFLYLAYTAPHWPLHALPEDISKYKGSYMKGWDQLREDRFRRMQQAGIIDNNTKLSPRNEQVASWESTSQEEKLKWSDKMSVYAAMVDRLDQNVGRLVKKLREMGQEKNTVIIFLSDNGASNESISGNGFTPDIINAGKMPSSEPGSFTAYELQGAILSNTPFRMFKRYEYEGGTATPFIACYPGVIKSGMIDKSPAHITDIMATCLDLAGISYPTNYNGNSIVPTEGISLLPLFTGKAGKQHKALFFEHEGNRAVRQGDWKLVSEYPGNVWHLFNMNNDRTEMNDLVTSQPQRVTEMIALYNAWATKAGVVPFEELDRKSAKVE